ncbi:Leucine-rich repeat domain, L domain-like [Phytophthora cactorum]|nr:Leucine-rich repeat domain, L domain-like [Phytophthora cactorum]
MADGDGVSHGGVDAVEAPTEDKMATLASLVCESDDVADPKKDQTQQQGSIVAPRDSIVMPRKSGAAMSESSAPRPSVVNIVAAEVATFFDVFVIQVHADEMANIIMNTTDFDNGKFWLLPQPESALIVSSVVLLSLFGIGYAGLAVIMLFFYRAGGPSETNELHENATPVPKTPDNPNTFAAKSEQRGSQLQRIISWIRLKCDLPIEIRQHYYTAALDLPKLIFQTLTLFTYLENGFPTPIIYTYSVLLLCNWLVACYRSQHYVADPALVIARLYYLRPGGILDKNGDDRSWYIRYSSSSFRRSVPDLEFLQCVPLLAVLIGLHIVLQVGAEPALSVQMEENLMTLIHNRHERQLERKRKVLVGPVPSSLSRTASIKVAITKQLTASKLKFKMEKHFCSKLFLSLVFLCAGIGNFVYSIGAIVSTTDLCSKYDKCVVASYYWNFGQKYCTCLVFADRQTAPKTYAEWTDPEDTAANLAELAHAGELRIVQIINRAVPELPEELRNCEYLEQLILAYTKTEVLPEWLSEFSHLEYFIPNVEKLPSLSSLKSLRYLTLAVLDSLKEIPSFDGLSRLSDLTIINAPRAATLPSMEPLASLTTMVLRPKSAVCCNGFISGTCNMTMTQCLPVASEKYPPTCTDARISEDDKAVLATFGASICPNTVAVDREAAAPSKRTTDELCGGVNYKECVLDGVQGICYNTRMMVINCEKTSGYIAMRKLQIQRGVGDPCDPDVEAWLGCKCPGRSKNE